MIVLVHGGLWEDMDAERFWVRPGIVAALTARGAAVAAPDRIVRASSWVEEVAWLAPALPDELVTLVGGSNGCSVAALLAIAASERVERVVLAWPATAGDARIDTGARARGVPDGMLAGETLRGIADDDLARLPMPVGIVPSPGSPFHRRPTVDALLGLVPDATELPACPESPRPDFPDHRDSFVAALLGLIPYGT